jgi:outer membrane murein-binding lipoprotein Lpp
MKLLTILAVLVLAGCAKETKRAPIVFPPVNPDVAAVKTIVTQTKASAGKASAAAERAVQIVEKIVVAPGQEQELEKLRWELSTTIEQLKFTSEFLENANAQVGRLENQVADMKRWGVEQNTLYVKEYGRAQRAEKAWVEADKAVWARNKIIVIQWVALAGLVLWIFKGPLLSLLAMARKVALPI